MTSRTPGESVAQGFSQKTCLLALIAAVRCCGLKPGGVASSTTSTAVDHLVVRIQPDERVIDLHAASELRAALQPGRRLLRRSPRRCRRWPSVRCWDRRSAPARPRRCLVRRSRPARASTRWSPTGAEMMPGKPAAIAPATPVFLRKSRRSILSGSFFGVVMMSCLMRLCRLPTPNHIKSLAIR